MNRYARRLQLQFARNRAQVDGALLAGYGLTTIWFTGLAVYMVATGGDIVSTGAANFGNFVAGCAAPLAFLWLVVATLLQRKELSLQRRDLQVSQQSFALQASEMRRLADESKAANERTAQEFARQEYTRFEERLDRLLNLAARRIKLRWRDMIIATGNHPHISNTHIFGNYGDEVDHDRILQQAASNLRRHLRERLLHTANARANDGDLVLREVAAIHSTISRVIDGCEEDLGGILLSRVEMIDLDTFQEDLLELQRWLIAN